MTYQLAISFPAFSIADCDRLVKLENKLVSFLGKNHDIDGHDFGQDEFSMFILTNDPAGALDHLLGSEEMNIAKMASAVVKRKLTSENSKVVWSKG